MDRGRTDVMENLNVFNTPKHDFFTGKDFVWLFSDFYGNIRFVTKTFKVFLLQELLLMHMSFESEWSWINIISTSKFNKVNDSSQKFPWLWQ